LAPYNARMTNETAHLSPLYAERAALGSTALYFDPTREQHAMTAFYYVAPAEIVIVEGRSYQVVWK
jgi:hypothetical protein